jgi:protein-disulfide isomerase
VLAVIEFTPKTVSSEPLSRRLWLVAGAVAVLAPVANRALAQARPKGPAEVPIEELMKPGPLPDLVIGKSDAKVTIVEYASLTCGHCAAFHNTVLPELKKKYIDSGQVRLILRDFPLDNLAAAGAMLARCAGTEKAPTVIEALFKGQDNWVVRGNPVPKLFETVKGAGFTQEAFDKCLTDQKLLDSITQERARAAEKFGVSSTPTFFINGKRFTGAPTVGEFDKVIDPLLKG